MASYKYNLQNILDLKINIEDEKKNTFGLAIKRLEDEKNILVAIEQALDETRRVYAQKTEEGIAAYELQRMLNEVDYYKRSIKKQKARINMAETYLEECRAALIKASQEKKMMEKLKEIDYKKYLYEEQKKEDKLVDDLVSFKESKKQ